MLDYYDKLDNYEFNFQNNNTISVSDILVNEYGCLKNNEFQVLREDIAVYPDNILCNPSGESVSIHVFNGSWLDEKKPLKRKINKFFKIRLTNKKRAAWYRKRIQKKQ